MANKKGGTAIKKKDTYICSFYLILNYNLSHIVYIIIQTIRIQF